MRFRTRLIAVIAAMVAGVGLLAGQAYQANAATTPAPAAKKPAPGPAGPVRTPRSAGPARTPGPARLADPGKMLPPGWQRSSDEAVTVAGDATGLHVLVASERRGYAWKTVATLGDPAVQTNLWIGQACVTASGNSAVVVYAPEQVANMAEAQGLLGRAAVVNLRTGAVKNLGGGFSVAYFDPGCGAGNTAVLTRGGWANDTSTAAMKTTLVVADAVTGRVSATVKVAGQVTSAVPYHGQIAASGGRGLEQISTSGKTRLLAATPAVPFRLVAAADGSLGYQTMAGKRVGLWRLASEHARRVASAPAGSVELRQIGGRVWLVGPRASRVAGLPRHWQPVDAPVNAQPSTLGTLAVTAAGAAARVKGQRYDPGSAQPVTIGARLLTGQGGTASFKVATTTDPRPVARVPGRTASRRAPRAGAAQATGSGSTPVSDDRTCAIPLNDPQVQAYQPTFKQVEWAADQAVQGSLTDTRPAGLYGSALPSYTPQGLFPPPAGPDNTATLPAQVLLGVLTAESNLQQASIHVIQGQTSNPLDSFNWYGNWINGETTNTGLVNFQNSDCGYGIGQITSGMCLAQGQNNNPQCEYQAPMPADDQLAVAVDYQANIAKATQLLMNEWNTLWDLGIRPDNPVPAGDAPSAYIGNWYMAIWAYNSGLEPGTSQFGNTTGCSPSPSCTDSDGNWGLGYADNPINPVYPPDRPVFPGTSNNPTPEGGTYSTNWDLSHPQYWPYQEKVIAWAFDSINLYDYSQGKDVQAFAWAHGNTMVPSNTTFCVVELNDCAPSVDSSSATAPDSCQLANDHCWWHESASWPITVETSSCSNCGIGVFTYQAGAPDPGPEPIAAQFAQTCDSNLPSSAVIVGDGGQSALGCPGQNWTSQGSFTWNFAPDANGNYSSKIAFDQIGAGFGGHFWFGYSQPSDDPSSTVITGTWNPPSGVSGWTDVKVAIPSYGANAAGALYQVDPGGGRPGKDVVVDQGDTAGGNTWVDLGTFDLGSGASVSLSNVTPDTYNGVVNAADSDLAWSAAAFIPASAPVYPYIALGDSYSSGEGNPPYDDENDGCDRSPVAWPRQFAADQAGIGEGGINHLACSGATIANLTTTGENGEPSQISQMTPDAQLVTVTIGGNDAGFSGILKYCLANPLTCETNYNSADDDTNEYTRIENLEPQLVAAYQAIQAQEPNARIVAVTYPNIFEPSTTCPSTGDELPNGGLTAPDVDFLVNLTLYLDNTIMSAAREAGISVMDERYAFLGHELCSATPDVIGVTDTPDLSAWFHPNAAGQAQIKQDMNAFWPTLRDAQGPASWPPSGNVLPGGWLPANLPYGIPTTAQAQQMLASLPETDDGPVAAFSRNAFGGWATYNGCDVRNRVLRAQALDASQWTGAAGGFVPLAPTDGTCAVSAGSWETPYDVNSASPTTPVQIPFTSAPGMSLPIDHVVPLKDAWNNGASEWVNDFGDQGTQLLNEFANDQGGPQLLVVSQSSNSSKQHRGPQSWMPANQGMVCAYARMWVAVKYDWGLGVSILTNGTGGQTELLALQGILSSC